MSGKKFDIDDLKRILIEGSGEPDGPGISADRLDDEFDLIGYDSLALLETTGRVEREYDVRLDETRLAEMKTPRDLIAFVNQHMTQAAPSA
ncbi:acyl carrier protein [Actinokineospora sp. PR83]|uniref:acyl carrier protein n=1 Tax=Actinokineospora sp. PR83 TaxID=2884908 RepID=UPI001F4825C6|nr:acyl carrier protein [Actinokineospora sp. PR83]MCG8916943.1 acyl carrier protein [Actinokineospora sp. PR83]